MPSTTQPKLPRYRAVVTIEVECPVVGCDWATTITGTASHFPSPRTDFEQHWLVGHQADWTLPRVDPVAEDARRSLRDILSGLAPEVESGARVTIPQGTTVRVEFTQSVSQTVQVVRSESGRVYWGDPRMQWSSDTWT